MAEQGSDAELARVRAERDFYQRLLTLGQQRDLEPFLREALALIVELDGATRGYLELHADEDEDRDSPRFWMAHGFSEQDLPAVRAAISRGIIAEALAQGRTVVTPSAITDERFSSRPSVRQAQIEAVLCAPIGEDPPRGVVYLQGRSAAGVFSVEEEARAAAFARHVAPYADLLLARRQEEMTADPVAPLRTTLRLANVIGASPALAAVLKQASVAAPLGVSVLLLGESGTGKSQLARLIHDNSPRADGPFVEINCATVPEALAEGELFGALPGGHSTATRRMYGKVAAAEKGTLFLDEVGELSLGAQAKLLQLLQSKEYYPLGSPKPMRADIRLIAATNSDLERAVAQRTFREDLFYRLNVLPVRVPSLTERRRDIPLLARHFCAAAWEQHHMPRIELSRAALRAIESAEWPGNVRQLANAIEAAVIRAVGEGAREVERVHVFPASPKTREAAAAPLTFQQATREFQCRLLQDALAENDWNIVQTARRLDLARAHVYNLIRAFGLERAPAA